MTHWTDAADLIGDRDEGGPGVIARFAPGALAFALSAALGVYLVYLRPFMHSPPAKSAVAQASPFGELSPPTLVPADLVAAAKPAPQPSANPFGALVLHGFGSTTRFDVAEAPIPTPPARLQAPDDDETAPLPPRRPSALARLAAPEIEAPQPQPPSVARVEPAPATPGIFQKLFGGTGDHAAKTEEPALAYAAPPPVSASSSVALSGRTGMSGSGGGGFGGFLRGLSFGSSPASRFGDHVAVYDISARVVYLPDGTRLEAHSGLGVARDDPNSVNVRMRGATPPATYALSPREALFHGVAALRLTPVEGSVFGRVGLLAHTYMLGAEGDSNGCISFRDYDAFLRAYRSGEISKLVVVTRL